MKKSPYLKRNLFRTVVEPSHLLDRLAWHRNCHKNRAKHVRKHVQIYKIFPVDDQLSVFDSAGSILQKMQKKIIIPAEIHTS